MRGDLPKREPGWVKEGKAAALQAPARRPLQAPPSSSCTTARPTPTARSTSATRRQQDPQGHDRQGAPAPASTPPTSRLGLPRPADRERRSRKTHGRNLPRDEVQAKSRAFATEQIDQQMPTSSAWACWATGTTLRTMDFANEAGEIRALKRLIERGFVYRGLKPVYWCFDCGSSLAEFEIEYADKKSPRGRGLPGPTRPRWRAFGVDAPLRPDAPSPSSGPPRPGPSRQPGAEPETPSCPTRWSKPPRAVVAGRGAGGEDLALGSSEAG